MKRRDFIRHSAALGVIAALPSCTRGGVQAKSANEVRAKSDETAPAITNPLKAPDKGMIPVAFVVSEGTVMIDFAGPWEVFNNVMIPSRGKTMEDQMPFQTYVVAQTLKPVSMEGVKIVPQYTFENAPAPKVVVIPAQQGANKAMSDWIVRVTKSTDVTMSVCTGAFVLASTGLLAGKPATTHHAAYKSFAMQFPDVKVKRGVRFVEDGNLATSGGLSSGIDLALHVVDRYFGRKVASDAAYNLEYQGQGWINPDTNAVYLQTAVSTDAHPLCPVCSMEVDGSTAPKSVYNGKTYYFCSADHKAQFDSAPEKWVSELR